MYFDKYRLDGKTAFVTGGGRGIGLAAAAALAAADLGEDVAETVLGRVFAAAGLRARELVGDRDDRGV